MPLNSLSSYKGPTDAKASAGKLNGVFDPSYNPSGVTLSNGNLTAAVGGNQMARSTNSVSTGKAYFEVHIDTWSSVYGPIIAFARSDAANINDVNSYGFWVGGGQTASCYTHGGNTFAYGSHAVIGDTIGVLIDLDALTISFYLNGNSMGVAGTVTPGTYYAMIQAAGSAYNFTVTANFGATAFK